MRLCICPYAGSNRAGKKMEQDFERIHGSKKAGFPLSGGNFSPLGGKLSYPDLKFPPTIHEVYH